MYQRYLSTQILHRLSAGKDRLRHVTAPPCGNGLDIHQQILTHDKLQLKNGQYTWAHTGLGPGEFLRALVNHFEVNVPESSGVARNGLSRARPGHSKIYSVNNSSLFRVASYTVCSYQFCTDRAGFFFFWTRFENLH